MSIRNEIAELVEAAARAAQAAGDIPPVVLEDLAIERPARPEHGDYASSLPLRLARTARQSPIAIAETIARHMPAHVAVGEVSVAPPGFVNLRLSDAGSPSRSTRSCRRAIVSPRRTSVDGRRLQVEFVSANPTGRCTSATGAGRRSATRWRASWRLPATMSRRST